MPWHEGGHSSVIGVLLRVFFCILAAKVIFGPLSRLLFGLRLNLNLAWFWLATSFNATGFWHDLFRTGMSRLPPDLSRALAAVVGFAFNAVCDYLLE